MKLNDVRPVIETSGGMEEQFFSIQDQGMIFDILRNKMYSNPILAICREISCNARDAHREVNKADQPCQITLPNSLEPFYKIKDWGPGISPDRMSNIFIRYTASTKRLDNVQTGGFGLGAKTPFSYSDTFTIETVFNVIKYNYACVIDETKVGKLLPMSQENTDQPNGTEIIIPVKPQDFRFFREGTEFVTRHWDVKPIIKGDRFDYLDIKPSLSGKDWFITKNDPNSYYSKRDIKLVIDGIEYPVDITQLKGYASTKVLDAIYGTIYLSFGVGELSLSASREAVHLDKPTQDKISQKIEVIGKDLSDNVKNKIDALTNLWDANLYLTNELSKTFANLAFLGKIQWKGYELHNGYLNTEASIFEFYKGGYSRRSTDPDKLSRSLTKHVNFKPNSVLYFNDLGIKDPTVKHVSTAFTNDKTLVSLQVICLPDKMTLDDLNKKYHFDQMNMRKLSEITKATKARTISGVRLLTFKFDPNSMAFKQVAYSAIEEDENDKVLCRLERDDYNGQRRTLLKNKNYIGTDTLKSILENASGVSIYGIDSSIPQDKIDESFENFSSIDDFVDEIFKNKKIDYVELKYIERNQYSYGRDKDANTLKKYENLIKDNNSIYLKNLALQVSLKEIYNKSGGLLKIYENVKGSIAQSDMDKWLKDNPDKDLKLMSEKVTKTYPLLSHVDYYYHDKLLEPLTHYINLIDKDLKDTN